MLKIRLRRMGSRQDPFYRVVVSRSESTPSGRFLESLGTYDPQASPGAIRLDLAKAEEWIRKGAHASDTVKRLLERSKIQQA